MNEKTKNFLRNSWNEPQLFFLWLTIFSLFSCIGGLLTINLSGGKPPLLLAWVVFLLALLFILSLPAFALSCVPQLRPAFAWLLRRRWLVLASLVTLLALFVAIENWRGRRAWQAFKEEATKAGEKLEVADIIPPPVPDEQNFAASPILKPLNNEFDPEWRRAHSGPNGLTNSENQFQFDLWQQGAKTPEDVLCSWSQARRTDFVKLQEYYRSLPKSEGAAATNDFPVAPQPQAPAADVLLALSKFEPLIRQLRAAASRPYSRFPIRYEDGFGALLPHLARLKGCTQVLALRANAELALGKSDEALADVRLNVRVMDAVKDEPFLISQLVRMAQMQIILGSIWEGLADHRWSDAQLATLQDELSRQDFLADYHTGMRGERALAVWSMDFLRRERDMSIVSGGSSDDPNQGLFDSSLGAMVGRIVPGGWFDQNKVSLLRMHRDYILPAVDMKNRLTSPTIAKNLIGKMNAGFGRIRPYDCFGPLLLPALGNAAERSARSQASVDLGLVACALERYRLANGSYPQTLDPLAPKFIAKLPHDVINGQPFKYHRTADGQFVLYSVGWNEKDDGGEAAPEKRTPATDSKTGDWVWRYTAK